MANNIPFQPMGNCVAVTVTAAANTQSNVFSITATSPVNQYYLVNYDTQYAVYVWISNTNNFNVALPLTASNQVIPIPAYGAKVVTGPQCGPNSTVYAKVIGDNSNATCFITPGEGF